MRVYTCPPQYERYVKAAIAIALGEIARDSKYRESGDAKPIISDSLIDFDATGDRCVLMVGVTDDMEQFKNAIWPDVPKDGESQFGDVTAATSARSLRSA